MIGWLLAGGLSLVLVWGPYLWVVARPSRGRRPGTEVAVWRPVPDYENCENCEPDLDAEFGRAVLHAADRYREMTRP